MNIIDLDELRIDGKVFVRDCAPSRMPSTDGWMHSGCAIADDGTVVVAHPQGRRLFFMEPSGNTRTVPVPVLEMHAIQYESAEDGESYWLVNNGHRFEKGATDYNHYRELGSVVRVGRDGHPLQELDCPRIDAYARAAWRPTSLCRDHEGALWVADGYGEHLVHKFENYRYVRTVDGSATGTAFACPHGIALRGSHILVADRSNRRIVVLDDGEPVSVLKAPLTSPSSLLVMGDWLLVTELFGGLAVFRGDDYVGHFARSHDDPTRDAWPNVRRPDGAVGRPSVGNELHSPHGIAGGVDRIVITEWMIGGRVQHYRKQSY